MSHFYINNCERGSSRSFDDLEVKGYFSLNGEHEIKFDCSELRYYKEKKESTVDLDLNDGIESARHFNEALKQKSLGYMLRWIQEKHETIESTSKGEKWLKPNFICRRGVIEKLLRTPHETKDGWIICAMKWRGNIYLSPFDTKDLERKEDRTPFHNRATCWGHKFEQYMLSECADALPNIDKPVDQNPQFCVIFQSRVGNHVLLYSAKMDAVCSDETMGDPLPLDKLKFIELKTTRILQNQHHQRIFKTFTTPKWWCQCAPVGIKNLVCGFRSHEGIVKELKTYSLDQLANISKKHLNPVTSMNFLDKFLTHIASTVVNDCDETIYKFESIPARYIRLTEESPSSEYNFIPQWYIENKL